MFMRLGTLLRTLLGETLARILAGAGLSFASYAALTTIITQMLGQVVASFSNVPANMLAIVLLAGCGEAVSIIGAAMLTKAALSSAMLGLKRST